MNREIKFRAQRLSGEWVYFTLENLINDSRYRAEWPRLKNVTQNTGLKDKNGKQIYEGDLIIVLNELGQPEGEVVWNQQSADYEIMQGGDFVSAFGIRGDQYEVIGNIFENNN